MIRAISFPILVILLLTTVLVAVGLGLGAILHLILPVLDLGITTLICMFALTVSTYVFIRFSTTPLSEEELEDEYYEKPTLVLEQYPFRKPRRRKSKKTS